MEGEEGSPFIRLGGSRVAVTEGSGRNVLRSKTVNSGSTQSWPYLEMMSELHVTIKLIFPFYNSNLLGKQVMFLPQNWLADILSESCKTFFHLCDSLVHKSTGDEVVSDDFHVTQPPGVGRECAHYLHRVRVVDGYL